MELYKKDLILGLTIHIHQGDRHKAYHSQHLVNSHAPNKMVKRKTSSRTDHHGYWMMHPVVELDGLAELLD